MELREFTDQDGESGTVKNEPVTPTGNGYGEDDTRRAPAKRKKSVEREEGSKKMYTKNDDQCGGEIPAHHARRPPNGFLLFCKRHRDIVSAKNPNLENRGVTKLLGNWWRTLEEEEREKYKELARQNKEIFIANNPQFTWYKLPAPPLRTLVTRPSNRRPPKLEPNPISTAGPITPGKLADESQLGGLTSLLSSSLSPPSTPVAVSPPSPTTAASAAAAAAPPPKKRFLLQTRTAEAEVENSLSESDEPSDNNKAVFKNAKKKYKKKKNWNTLKYKRNLKQKWSDSFSGKFLDNETESAAWKPENGTPNCTQQQLIEKIVDSSFVSQKPVQDSEIQRKLEYIHTEHTYQKNAGRFWIQQKPKTNKKEDYVPLQIVTKMDGLQQNIISPNVNNNTIVLTEASSDIKEENGLHDISYSFNDNNNLIIDYVNNQRKLDQSKLQTNHDRIEKINLEDGYIPGMYAQLLHKDCDNTRGLEDQKKPFDVAQDDDIPKNCDRDSNFQSILGKVSREIVSMINERGPEGMEEMAVARFNVQSRSETDSDGSWCDKSDASPPGSPGGRRPKRSCKGRRYEQFIKDSVSKKRNRNTDVYGAGEYRKSEAKIKKRKSETKTPSSDELDIVTSNDLNAIIKDEKDIKDVKDVKYAKEIKEEKDVKIKEENTDAFFPNEKDYEQENPVEPGREDFESSSQSSEDLSMKQGTKASDIIQMKLDLESKVKKEGDDRIGRRQKELKNKLKKKPLSKVQMIKEKRELHTGEFNLNEKIEELPLLSFESFLQKKRQRKKRMLGLRKECLKNKAVKNKFDKYKSKDLRPPSIGDVAPVATTKPTSTNPGQSQTKPDFADLATLAETALTLLALGEPR